MLKSKCANYIAKVTTLRNTTIPQTTAEFLKAADKEKLKEPDMFILKRRIETKKETQTAIVDAVIGKTEVNGREAQNLYKKLMQSPDSINSSSL